MPIKITHPTHSELVGTGYVLITTRSPAAAEAHEAQVVEDAALTSRAYAVIAKTGIPGQDSANNELVRRVNSIIDENEIKCVLQLQSKPEPGLEVQNSQDKTCTEETSNTVRTYLAKNFLVTTSAPDSSTSKQTFDLARKTPDGTFTVQSIRINVGNEELELRRDKLVDQLAELVGILNVRLGFDPSRRVVVED